MTKLEEIKQRNKMLHRSADAILLVKALEDMCVFFDSINKDNHATQLGDPDYWLEKAQDELS
jgi:hypothetical protein